MVYKICVAIVFFVLNIPNFCRIRLIATFMLQSACLCKCHRALV